MSHICTIAHAARRHGVLFLAGMLLSISLQSSLQAQFIEDSEFYYQNRFLIPASDAEEDKLYSAKDKHASEIKSLQEQLEKMEKELKGLIQDCDERVDELLSPAQWQSIQEQQRKATRERVEKNQVFLSEFVKFSEQIAKAEKFTVYEGLHRAVPDEIAAIKGKEKTIQFDGYDFYAQPLVGKPATGEQFRELLTEYQSFSPGTGKFCGGFHPDICLQYQIAGQEYRALICLGCWELRAVGPDEEYNFDFNQETSEAFLQIAKSIFVQRVNLGNGR